MKGKIILENFVLDLLTTTRSDDAHENDLINLKRVMIVKNNKVKTNVFESFPCTSLGSLA